MKGRKILVVGDIMLDYFIYGTASRISPEAPVPVVNVTRKEFIPGGAANVAANIMALGGEATVLGALGDDLGSNHLMSIFSEHGIDCIAVRDDRPTTVKTRVIASDQQVLRFDQEETHKIAGRALKEFTAHITELVRTHDAVVVSDYKKGVVTSAVMKALVKACGNKKFLAVDPKVGQFHLYKGVSIITPNRKEASEGSSVEISDDRTLLKAGEVLMKKLSLKSLLITRGKNGMSLFEKGRVTHVPTLAKQVYDVTGAGDTVIGAMALAKAAGASLEEAAVIANHAAGIVVAEVGTAVATSEALRESIRLSDISVREEKLRG